MGGVENVSMYLLVSKKVWRLSVILARLSVSLSWFIYLVFVCLSLSFSPPACLPTVWPLDQNKTEQAKPEYKIISNSIYISL